MTRRYEPELYFGFDGRLHVKQANISKAAVYEDLGKDVPGWRELGLKPDKTYRTLHSPGEMAKAAPTFNGVPLTRSHGPFTAKAHDKKMVVGSTGTQAGFVYPYLQNTLVLFSREAIEDVTENKHELSIGYRYRVEKSPGTYQGRPYDLIARDIVGNHVAIVDRGAAGPECDLKPIFRVA
jgi:hypothetical protein